MRGEFENALTANKVPNDWGIEQQSLWFDVKGDWHQAHDLVDGAGGQLAKGFMLIYTEKKETIGMQVIGTSRQVLFFQMCC